MTEAAAGTVQANAPPLEELSLDTPPPYSPFPANSSYDNTRPTSMANLEKNFSNGLKLYPEKKLGHMDFVPRVIQKRLLKEDLYDTQTLDVC